MSLLCRCGEPAAKVCHLCKCQLCEFHAGAKPASTPMNGYTRIRLEPACFPDCTSSFGQREEPGPKALPVARA